MTNEQTLRAALEEIAVGSPGGWAEKIARAALAATAIPAEPEQDDMSYRLSCGCPSAYGGFPAEWPTETRECEPALALGNICEKHFYEYEASPQQNCITAPVAQQAAPEQATDEFRIDLENGKYTYIRHANGQQEALRYGEAWRDLAGDKFVYLLAARIEELAATSPQQRDESKDAVRSKDHCPECGELWDEHEWGVPAPYCPTPKVKGSAS